ncbi:MAG: LON peptidase substrate-binding domain-containing protein [Actinobacteria bacterium]|nr:LON peptidase substrate-binding domain-containing protein [Actinomycetota bacterium]
MDPLPDRLPLFPLQLVLLPGELLPLHIFEERYKNLVARCVETREPFGVVLRLGDGVAAVGCLARLVAVLEEFPDGRSNIVVRGEAPFRILAIDTPEDADQEPMSAAVEYLEEEPTEEPEPAGTAEADALDAPALLDELLRRLGAARGDDPSLGDEPVSPGDEEAPFDAEDDDGRDQTQRSFRIAVDLDLGLSLKQRLLESRRESERLALITDYLETIIPRLELIESRREAIRGNGKGD